MDINEIKKVIPHRFPMLLIDRIVECDDDANIVALKNVTHNEPFFEGHFPGYPVMPGVLIVEAMAQAACVLALRILKKEGHPVILFTGIDETKFRKPVIPGDQLKLELAKIKQRGDLFRFQGKAFVGDQLVAQSVLQAVLGKSG